MWNALGAFTWGAIGGAMIVFGSSFWLLRKAKRHMLAARLPRRGDAVEAWLIHDRDRYPAYTVPWRVVDHLLCGYRLHADKGMPLGITKGKE